MYLTSNMLTYPRLINAFGLVTSMVGSVVLIWPYLIQSHHVDDDLIEKMDMKAGKFLQKKHSKERKINITGFLLLGVGFLFQFVSIFLEK